MKKLSLIAVAFLLVVQVGCKKDDPDPVTPAGPGESTTDLLVAKFTAAPTMDGTIDAMWGNAQTLVGTAEVPTLSARNTYLNSDGAGVEEGLGLFAPYAGEKNAFKMRSGTFGDNIYFLIEWEDNDDSKDRQSWYFDSSDKTWKQEHKYANTSDDKFYEDKFAFLFPIGDVSGFANSTCYATCHGPAAISNAKDKHTRHYLNVDGEKVDMWHWKRVRGNFLGQVDDQKMLYDDPSKGSAANGRTGDSDGSSGYANNSVTLNNGLNDVNVPKYIIPGRTDYFWVGQDEVDAGTALEVTAVDGNGVLTLSDGSTLDAFNDAAYAQSTGNKRVPSVVTSAFTGGRGDISIKAIHTGSGWVAEVSRKLNTGDVDDVIFDSSVELPFGFAIFDNAAIAHAIKPGLMMKFAK